MTFTRGLFIHPDATRGTTALEARQSLAGIIVAPGVLGGMTVTGTAGWQYSVAAGHVATSRGIDTDGIVAFANDAPVLVDCSPAPGTGARIDIVYAKHNDATTPNADPDSEAFAAVAEGVASGTPVAPEIPDGAVELARATVGAGATNTQHANVTISHADQARSAVRGSIVTVANDQQRNATYNSTDQRPIFAWREDTNTLEVTWGQGWKRIYPAATVAGERSGTATTSVPNSEYTLLSAGNTGNYTGGVSGGGGGIIVPVNGWYQVSAGVRWDSNSTGYRILVLRINGDEATREQTNAGGYTINTISKLMHLKAGDNITLQGWQNSGARLSTSAAAGFPYLGAALIGQD